MTVVYGKLILMDTSNQQPEQTLGSATASPNLLEFNTKDSTLYYEITQVLKTAILSDTLDKTLCGFLQKEDVPYSVKKKLCEYFNEIESARLWNWEYLKGETLCTWGLHSSLDGSAFLAVMKNDAFTVESMMKIFYHGRMKRVIRYSGGVTTRKVMRAEDTFSFGAGMQIMASNKSCTDEQVLDLTLKLQAFDLSITVLIPRLRVIYNVSDDIPDSWVEHMMK